MRQDVVSQQKTNKMNQNNCNSSASGFTKELVKRCALKNVAEGEGLVAVAGPPAGPRSVARAWIVVVVVVPAIGRGSTAATSAVAGVGAAVAVAAGRGFVQRGTRVVDPALTC